MTATTLTGLDLLRAPFEPGDINKLPKPYNKDAAKGTCKECGGYHGLPAVHLDYVGHAALTKRLLDSDPKWSWEPLALGENGLPVYDENGGLWIRLTVCGITRLGYGDAQGKRGGNAIKEAIGDALRNAGMRFGAALDLWHKGDFADAEVERGVETPKATPAAPVVDESVAHAWVAVIKNAATMAQLQAAWTGAGKEGAQKDPKVIAAKDARKKELSDANPG